jgi:hypothetical protein
MLSGVSGSRCQVARLSVVRFSVVGLFHDRPVVVGQGAKPGHFEQAPEFGFGQGPTFSSLIGSGVGFWDAGLTLATAPVPPLGHALSFALSAER